MDRLPALPAYIRLGVEVTNYDENAIAYSGRELIMVVKKFYSIDP